MMPLIFKTQYPMIFNNVCIINTYFYHSICEALIYDIEYFDENIIIILFGSFVSCQLYAASITTVMRKSSEDIRSI